MAEPKVAFKVICGCGSAFQTAELTEVGAKLREARAHADTERHSMEIRGFITVERSSTPVKVRDKDYQPKWRSA